MKNFHSLDNYKPKPNKDWQLHWLDDQPMLFSKCHDGVHLLNPVAGFIRTCCDGKTDVKAIRKALQDVFVDNQDEVAKDLPNTLELWQKQGLIDFLYQKTVSDIKSPIGIRLDTSDLATFQQIFINKDYDFSIPSGISPKFIVDGGANVGYASIWFANKFPDSHIIAIEPESNNFSLLKENTLNYQNITLMKAGIWNKNCELEIVTHDSVGQWLGYWGIQVLEAITTSRSNIQAISIDEILQKFGYKQIDILKLDVEGSEKEFFSDNYETWLNKTNIIILELHDRFKPGCYEAVYSAIKLSEFNSFQQGENLFFIRKQFLMRY